MAYDERDILLPRSWWIWWCAYRTLFEDLSRHYWLEKENEQESDVRDDNDEGDERYEIMWYFPEEDELVPSGRLSH